MAFIAFTLYIYQLKEKFKNHDEPDFDYWTLKKSLLNWFWLYSVLYGLYWGTFFFMSLDKKNLTYIDFTMSAAFPIMMLILISQGVGLIKQIPDSFYQYDTVNWNKSLKRDYDWTKTPGIYQLLIMLILQCTFMFFRFILVSLPDIAKVNKIKSI